MNNFMMQPIKRLAQAYRLAPWRKQTQEIGVYLTFLVVFILVASVYVNITARAAADGRQIQQNHADIERIEREIADLQSQLAVIESDAVLRQRARELGFRRATPDDIIHVAVSGYQRREAVDLGSSSQPSAINRVVVSPAFTQSWVDWVHVQLRTPLALITDNQP
jgi:cell division protein FtsB